MSVAAAAVWGRGSIAMSVKRHRGEPGHTLWTHTGHTGQTGARGHTDHTDEPHNYPPKPNDTNPHENRTDHTDRYVGTNERPENSRERQYFLTNLATMCLA